MNTEEHISSGKLEEYLLGLLSEQEAREVEQEVMSNPEVRAELNAMEDALMQYAQAKGVPMPPDLQNRIIRRIEALDEKITKNTKTKIAENKSDSSRFLGILALLLAGAIGGCLFLLNKNSQLEDNLSQTQVQLQTLQENCDQLQNTLDKSQTQLAILRSDGNHIYVMRGTDNNPGAIANIYYNPQQNKTYLDIRQLPPPPAGQQYQLWGINAAGAFSMDVFNVPPNNGTVDFIEVPFLADISTFAVSLEPTGGSSAPTAVHLISG